MQENILKSKKIVAWTVGTLGPLCGSWLGTLGAEVITVEMPSVTGKYYEEGAYLWHVPIDLGQGLDIFREPVNYNKKSIAINLKQEEGKKIVYELVAKSDVFITNQSLGLVNKFNMEYESLLKFNPKLVYASASMFGLKGPHKHVPGYDIVGQARSGMMSITGGRGEPPVIAGQGIGDCTTALCLMTGVVLALLNQELNGALPQKVETSQLQALLNVPVAPFLAIYTLLSQKQREENQYYGEARENKRDDAWRPFANHYKCKDGRYLYILASVSQKWWEELLEIIGRSDLIGDPRLANRKKQEEHNKELISILDDAFAKRTLEEWAMEFVKAKFPWSPVNRLRDLPDDSQVVENKYLFTYKHPFLGQKQLPGMPFTINEDTGRIRIPTVLIGEHTEEILTWLGYSNEDISILEEKGVVQQSSRKCNYEA